MYIYKTVKIPVKTSKTNIKLLFEMNKESAKVWNDCVILSCAYLNQTGKWMSKIDLKKNIKGKYNINSKSVQLVIDKFSFARNSAKELRKTNINIKYPYKFKKYFNTYWTYQDIRLNYNEGWIGLARNNLNVNNKYKRQKPVKIYSKSLPKNIVQVELIYQNRLFLNITYKDYNEYLQISSKNSASIDLGEIHSICSIDNNQNAIIITGRKLRSIKRFRNKKQAQLQKLMSKCTKHSKQWRKYKKAWNYIRFKTQRQINDCIHKITKLYVDFSVLNNIKTVYIGRLEGVQRNTKGKRSKFINQKLTQFGFGEMTRILKYKLQQYGIELVVINEAYTSQICPNCGKLNKPNNRNYKCKKCGYTQHRDVNGAINILNDNSEYKVTHYKKLKYLQIT